MFAGVVRPRQTFHTLIRAPGAVVEGEEKRRVPQLRFAGRRRPYAALANKMAKKNKRETPVVTLDRA